MKAKIIKTGEIVEVVDYDDSKVTVYRNDETEFFAQNEYKRDELEFLPDTHEEVIYGWVARDANGDVNIFDSRPHIGVGDFWMNDGCYYLMRDLQYEVSDIFPSLTYENSPKRVRITLTPMEE